MTTSLRLRRGSTTQHASFTGALGEVTVDTTKNTLVVHDGATVGGIPMAKESSQSAAVRYDTAAQGLNATQKANARTNILAAPVPASTGLTAALDDGTSTGRAIASGTGITVANGDGKLGNPTITNDGVTSVGGAKGAITLGSGLSMVANALSCSLTVPVNSCAELFTASGSWVCPSNVSRVKATVIGAGGGGGGKGAAGDLSSNGGPGGLTIGYVDVTPGATYTVTVGVAGAAFNTAAAGSAGGSSSFGSLITATGGGGGTRTTVAGTSGAGTGGNIRNGNVSEFLDSTTALATIGEFMGLSVRPAAVTSTAGVTWSSTLGVIPGAAGSAEASYNSSNATGGVGGLVYLEF